MQWILTGSRGLRAGEPGGGALQLSSLRMRITWPHRLTTDTTCYSADRCNSLADRPTYGYRGGRAADVAFVQGIVVIKELYWGRVSWFWPITT